MCGKRKLEKMKEMEQLEEKKFLKHSEVLFLYARLTDSATILTGSYEFYPNQSPLAILQDLGRGRVVTERLTIIEGFNRWQIRDGLAKTGWIIFSVMPATIP